MKKSLAHLPEYKCEELKLIVGARYHDDYKITPQELDYLARCVELLREQTETSCEKKMEGFV